jgi:hypothetical protein
VNDHIILALVGMEWSSSLLVSIRKGERTSFTHKVVGFGSRISLDAVTNRKIYAPTGHAVCDLATVLTYP